MVTYKLRTYNPYFTDSWEGRKSFDIRQNKRNYKVGDILILQEYDPLLKWWFEKEMECIVLLVLNISDWLNIANAIKDFVVTI